MFDGLKMWLAAPGDHVLREQRERGRADEDPPAAQAPPVAVLRARHAQDEGDAVAGEQGARRPHPDVLLAGGDRDLEHRAGDEREQDLGDRDPEMEGDLTDTCSDVITTARCRRGSFGLGRTIGTPFVTLIGKYWDVKLSRAQAIVADVVDHASGPVSVWVVDGARRARRRGLDGRRRARHEAERPAEGLHRGPQRRPHDAGAGGRRSTAGEVPQSFDPFFTFFLGGVAVFEGDERIGAVGVSGLPGEVDEAARVRRYRTIFGSVKTSFSSRLRDENSETIAPSSPARTGAACRAGS